MEAKEFIAALVARGLTQSQIAERTGIPQPTLSKVLRGDVADVLSRNYRKLQALHDEVCGADVGANAKADVPQASAVPDRINADNLELSRPCERPTAERADHPHRRASDTNDDPYKARNNAQADLLAHEVGLTDRKTDKPGAAARERGGR
jgi:transcriptional regulator with XRE-family HTH domain